MLEYDFLKFIDDYISLYRDYLIPVVICDSSFKVYFSNHAAKSAYSHLTNTDGVRRLLMEFDRDELLSRLKQIGTIRIDGVPAFGGLRLNMTPLKKDGEVVGVAVLLVESQPAVHPQEFAQISRTPMFLQLSVRQSVSHIFAAMDDASVKADILDASWVKPTLRSIAQNSYYILRITDNISSYADLQSNPPVLSHQLSDVFELLRLHKNAACGLAAGMGVSLRFDLPKQGASAGVDANKFLPAFFNIVHNSLYFTRPDNEIEISGSVSDDRTVLTVSDKGVGIPTDALPHVFRAYFSLGHGLKPAGIGLGLTLAKIIVEAHGGDISVRSTEGKGTTVTISLPNRLFSRSARLSQGNRLHASDRFSAVYVGLYDAADSPYRQA